MTQPNPPSWSQASPELLAPTEPRIVRFNRWASAVALVLANLLMILMLVGALTIGTALAHAVTGNNTDTTTPGPLVTGCPFGDDQCGG